MDIKKYRILSSDITLTRAIRINSPIILGFFLFFFFLNCFFADSQCKLEIATLPAPRPSVNVFIVSGLTGV